MPTGTSKKNHDGMELSGIHEFLVYTDGGNILGENINTIRKNTEAMLETTKDVGLEVSTE
jgi:hypothetical protein